MFFFLLFPSFPVFPDGGSKTAPRLKKIRDSEYT